MDALILGLYAFIVWLIFFKFKLLPWNNTSMVIVVTIPIVGLTTLLLLLNVFAPSSADVRVIKYVINVIPQVRGRVIEVPVEPNRMVKKGAVLFRIDPTPYRLQVETLQAELVNAEGSAKKLHEELAATLGRTAEVEARLRLAQVRVGQNKELVAAGAGDKFALQSAQTDVLQAEAELSTKRADEAQVRAQLAATVGGDLAEVAEIRARLANAH